MRIISLSPAVTEILFALKKQNLIVARDQFSNFPEETKDIPKIQGHQTIDLGELKIYQPDLIFTSTIIQKRLAEEIRAAGFQCIHQDPRSLNAIYQSIQEIGTLLDCEADACALCEKMRQGMNEVKKRAQNLPRRPRLYIEEWPALENKSGGHDLPYASGNWVPEVARVAGGEQFPIPVGALSPKVTLEQIQQWNPEFVILSICGAGALADPSLITKRPRWESLEAIQKGRIKVIDDSLLNRPGPRLVEGAQRLYAWIFEMLH
ncbi:MAG TPA: ABC transporter substrate-binding protein [Candidatus Peribacterales bacterium]|nr:ABC transporter substrate-binding protein [Candidatus Peribacterales bacterium]